jgi:DNA-binding transcriptional regulator GbsR (MarR family)
MTEISENTENLTAAVERFVLKWGDMGSAWGVNRSVAQIHALLYLKGAPMTAEDISDALGIARSNVSNSLKELLGWNLIRRVPMRGDRRDHFEAEGDVWELVTRIAVARKAREIDPVMDMLRTALNEAESDRRVAPETRRRLAEMLDFTSAADRWFQQMLGMPRGKLKTLVKLGSKVAQILPGTKR